MTIIITGASSGVGAATALKYAEQKNNLVLVARRSEKLETIATQARDRGANVTTVVADVSVETECERIVTATLQQYGAIDVLVNNAGRGHRSNVEDTSTAVLESMFAVNVYSLFWLTQRVLPTMIANNSGYIVNISSVAGKQGFPFNSAYVAAKHAVVGFTASLRAELYGTNVHATVICPAGVLTEWSAVSEGGNIGDLFSEGIKASRAIARDKGLELAPLTPMKPADEIAEIIVATVSGGRSNDVYTHPGTQEQATLATTNRVALEDQFAALYYGMQQAYEKP